MNKKILKLRKILDSLDAQIIHLLKKRFETIKDIGLIKQNENIDIMQPERIMEIIHTRRKLASEFGISPSLIEKIYHLIIEESISLEKNL